MSYRQPFKGYYPITQSFGETYTDKMGHKGIDYACPIGTPILASEAGKVIFAGWDKTGYGNLVMILHPDGLASLYAHLSTISVTVGQEVNQGQIIGYSGSTGNSTGAHLHFEIRGKDGKAIDPAPLLRSVIDDIPKPKLIGADALGRDVEIVCPNGAWGWNADFTRRDTVFPDGTKLTFTGRTTQRLGYTYCECYPEPRKYWVAVNDGETQILDNQKERENADH